MKSYADTGFLVSLYLNEATTTVANAAVQTVRQPLPLIPPGFLESIRRQNQHQEEGCQC
jgi:hypothetical protein